MLSSARLLALVASTTFLAAVRAEKCANACYGESCDFWVKEWGMSCSLVESEIGCSCAGCACENTDTFEKNIRSFGRRTGNSTNSSTSAPTAAPTTADTTIVQAITTTFETGTTSDTYAAGTGGYKALCEAAYGVSLGIYTTSTNAWDTDCAVSSVAASSRRVDLTITYTATVSAAEASAATTAVSSLTAATLNTNAAAVNTAGTLTVTTVPTATTVATATVTTSAPTAAPTGSTFSGASSTSTVSILAFAAVLMAFNRA